MGELRILDPKAGDLKVIWNADNPDEVQAAREQFDALRKKGYMAWNVKAMGRKGDNEVKAFDPDLEKMIITPPVKKG